MKEKFYMSTARNNQLYARYPGEELTSKKTLEYKLEAEKRFGDCLFVPLDIPLIKDELFVEWYWENAKRVNKLMPDIASTSKDFDSFVSVDVAEEGSMALKTDHVWSTNFRTDFPKLFPKLIEQFYEYFPVTRIGSFSIWSSTEAIGVHRDHSIFLDIPSSFRIMLHDENSSPTLYVEEYKADTNFPVPNTRKYVPKLNDTNSFVWNNLRTKHGSDYTTGQRKILLIFKHLLIDWEKYYSLLDRSIVKYSNHYLKSNNTLDNFINL